MTCKIDYKRQQCRTNVLVTVGCIDVLDFSFVSGREMSISVYRNQQLVSRITDEKHYQFDSPYLYSFSDPITIRPGDEIRTQCVYDSTSRDNFTIAGSGYVQEMCFGFLTFYPTNAITKGSPSCVSWKSLPVCLAEFGRFY